MTANGGKQVGKRPAAVAARLLLSCPSFPAAGEPSSLSLAGLVSRLATVTPLSKRLRKRAHDTLEGRVTVPWRWQTGAAAAAARRTNFQMAAPPTAPSCRHPRRRRRLRLRFPPRQATTYPRRVSPPTQRRRPPRPVAGIGRAATRTGMTQLRRLLEKVPEEMSWSSAVNSGELRTRHGPARSRGGDGIAGAKTSLVRQVAGLLWFFWNPSLANIYWIWKALGW
jgi:hypothetical protein